MGQVLTSTTSSEAEMKHALSDNWREPFVAPEPVETPEAEETPAKTTDESETPETNESEKPKPGEKPRSKAQRTIDKLTARNHAAETRAEKAERELAELRAKEAPAAKTAPAQPSGPPKLNDFLNAGKTADEWADARDAYKQAESDRQEKEANTKAVFDNYNKHVSEARGKYDDFDEVVGREDLAVPQSVQLAVLEMDNGPEVAYYLGKHPELCQELLEMTPLAAVRKIGIISDRLSPEARSPEPKPKPKPPAPLSTVGASATRSSVPLDQLSPREYIEARNKQERARR
jgi:hypothetical protein